MKRKIATMFAVAALSCTMAFPALAAQTRAEYKEEAAPIRAELKSLDEEMKPLCQENKTVAAKYKSIRLIKKNNGELSVSKENWKKAKELHKQIVEIRKSKSKESLKELKAEAKAAVKTKDFDSAIQSLEKALEVKRAKQDDIKEMNELWKQIDALIS